MLSVLRKGNLLRARKTTREKLTGGHRVLLSRLGQSLHRAKNLRHPLRVIGEKHRNLGAHHSLVGTSPNGPLLTRNRATSSLQNELVQVLSAHKLHHLCTEGLLASPKVLGLRCESPKLII
jgi:hypothetical protein